MDVRNDSQFDKDTEAPKHKGKRAGWDIIEEDKAAEKAENNRARMQSDKVRALKLKEVYELLLTSRSESVEGNPLFNSETIY